MTDWKLSGIFGRRRRSTLTPDEQSCLAKCPDCKPFTSGDETAAYREGEHHHGNISVQK